MDGSELKAKLGAWDAYHLKIEVEGKERMIFKHALKWIEL